MKMAPASMLVHVTHIDDSVRGLQGPCIHFWGMTHDRSLYLTMELYLESVRQSLETKLPPLNLSDLEKIQICCVLINHRWQRARILELKLSLTGTIEVFCIDSGDTHSVPLAFVRTLDISGYEAENIRECPPLASKFILADVIAPCLPGTHNRQWSELAIMFLKIHVENHTWKAAPMGMYGTHQGVRLFDSNNQLLATIMIQQALGVAAQTYHEALSMCEVMNKQPAYMKPAFYTYPAMKLFPAGCNIMALTNPVRPAFAIPVSHRENHLAPQKAYTINNLPINGRHDVIVSHMSEGPFKFFVQMKSEASSLTNIRKKLNSFAPSRFHGLPLGSPCIAPSQTDELFHRGLITAVKDHGNPSCTCTVYFVDIGSQSPINFSQICNIPDELLEPCLCAYRVSLFGVQEVSNRNGLIEIFASLVKSASNLKVEVMDEVKQEVNLYDQAGRSIRDVLGAIFTNLQTTTCIPSAPSSLLTSVMNVAEMPSLNLADEESLFVNFSEKPGCFFGQLEKIRLPNSKAELGTKYLNEMAVELTNAYSFQVSPPHLYIDVESRLGHHGVIIWDVDQVYYRVRVTKELLNDAEVQFIDYGNSIWIPRGKILAPLGSLTRFRRPPYGVHCKLDESVNLPVSKWNSLILNKWIQVKMGTCIEGVYIVTFTSDPCNSEIVKILASNIPLKVEENVGKINQKIETSPPVSAQLYSSSTSVQSVSPLTSLTVTDNRQIKSNVNGNYSITFANKPCNKQSLIETNDENIRTATKGNINSGKCPNVELVKGIHYYQSTELIDCKAKAIGALMEETAQSEQLESSTFNPQTTSTNLLQTPSLIGNENPSEIQQELNQKFLPEIVELQEPTVVVEVSKLEVPPIQQYFYPKQPVLSGLDKQIEVVFVNDPSDFYVQLSESFADLEELVSKLDLVYSDKSKPAVQNPKPGSACVVQYEEDNLWYRGQIMNFCDPHLLVPLANVIFVDYGNTQRCPIKQIKAIDEEFVKLNPLAFSCRLNGMDVSRTWTAEEKNKLGNRCIGKTLTATFVKQEADAKYFVNLVEETEGGALIINEMFGKLIPASIAPPTTVYSKLSVSKTPIDVTITCCTDLYQFYLRPFDFANYQIQLDELEQFYSSLSPNELLEDQPNIELPCVIRFTEDERYYRSQIVSMSDGEAEILFVDYGIKQVTPLSQLKRITPRFMALPQLTWYCQLKGVKLNSPANAEVQKQIDACISTKEKITALFHPASSEGTDVMPEVELTLPTIGNVSQFLAQRETREHISSTAEIELVAQNMSFAPNQVIATHAITSYAKSPTEFWVQLEPESVKAIMTRIDKLAVNQEFINKNNFTAAVGKPCLAFFTEDGRWYRAVVEAVHENSSTVYYIDYGDSCIVETCDLRELPQDLAQIPPLAYKCCQEGAEGFSIQVAETYVNVIVELTAFIVKFVKVVDGVLYIRISHSDGIDLSDLCSEVPTELPEVPVGKPTENAMPGSTNIPDEELLEPIVGTVSTQVLGRTEEPSIRNPPQDYFALEETRIELVIQEPVKTIQHVEGYIPYCLSPTQFWFQTKQDDVKINAIQARLFESYDENSDAFKSKGKLVIDQIYGVKHPIFDGWYRGQIKKVGDATTEIYFVDYGDTQTVPLENIRELIKEYADVPPLATMCSLKNQLMEWLPTTVEKFNATCSDPVKLFRVVFGVEENGFRFVDSLFVGDKNVLDFLEADVKESV